VKAPRLALLLLLLAWLLLLVLLLRLALLLLVHQAARQMVQLQAFGNELGERDQLQNQSA
jgi:hypothetical protein